MDNVKAVIFDLDGVIVDTAQFHYMAWKKLAAEWNYALKKEDNEQLKGVSRMESVAKIAQWAGIYTTDEKLADVAKRKNDLYLALCANLTPNDVLPGIQELIDELKRRHVQIALGSASKNARFVLDRLGLSTTFDTIVDGNNVSKSKPNPEVFLKAAKQMGALPQSCVVIEDAPAGIEAALSAGMQVIGLGTPHELQRAHLVMTTTENLTFKQINNIKVVT
ncbi:MAG: beta-phosphoglucomutase [Flavobacteriaceae bacterium]